LSKIDIAIALLLAIGGFLGYRKGFLLELFFLVALVLGVFIGFKLMRAGVGYLSDQFNADTRILPYLSFLIIFILVVIVVYLVGKQVKDLVDKTFLGRADALVGAALGIVKYMFCISILFWLCESFHYQFPPNWTKGSWLYPVTVDFAPRMASLFGGFLPFFKEMFRQF
jgi:membrane protein required for colicin V production